MEFTKCWLVIDVIFPKSTGPNTYGVENVMVEIEGYRKDGIMSPNFALINGKLSNGLITNIFYLLLVV